MILMMKEVDKMCCRMQEEGASTGFETCHSVYARNRLIIGIATIAINLIMILTTKASTKFKALNLATTRLLHAFNVCGRTNNCTQKRPAP